MKPNELQIGDWVNANGTPKKITLLTATQPLAVDPIPLTEEILEANGFSIDDSFHPHRRWNSADHRVVLHNEDEYLNTFNKWHIHVDTEDMRTIGSVELTYVHQYQQFLRLCGMQERADNFKIDKI